jgi:predicted peroxiredoxin
VTDSELLLFVCTHGPEDPERATVPWIAAATAAASGYRAVVVCTIEGVWTGTARHRDIEADGTPALADLVATLVDHGGEIWLCAACTGPRGIEPEDTIEGATIVGAARIVEAMASGRAITLS